MRDIPEWLKRFSVEVVNDLLLVFVVALVFLGAAALAGVNAIDFLSEFTPLVLGLFGIAITVSSLKVNIKEGRERAERERNDSVRPILIMEGGKFREDVEDKKLECMVTGVAEQNYLLIELSNVGLGTATKITVFMLTDNMKYYRCSPDVHRLMPDETARVVLFFNLPNRVKGLLTRYVDVYGNTHFCAHRIDIATTDREFVRYNDYVYCDPDGVEKINKDLEEKPRSKVQWIVDQQAHQTIDPVGTDTSD